MVVENWAPSNSRRKNVAEFGIGFHLGASTHFADINDTLEVLFSRPKSNRLNME